MAKTSRRPYWLDDGDATCEVCGHTMIVQAEWRCTGCDAGVCEHCTVRIHATHDVVCIPCSALEEET
jgi:hypothetical protein